MTLEQLLKTNTVSQDKDGNEIHITPDFRIAVQRERYGGLHFIVHPLGVDGETLDFVVHGNTLTRLNNCLEMSETDSS